jgi:hypothetical protein
VILIGIREFDAVFARVAGIVSCAGAAGARRTGAGALRIGFPTIYGRSPSIMTQQYPREMRVLLESRSVVIGPVRS